MPSPDTFLGVFCATSSGKKGQRKQTKAAHPEEEEGRFFARETFSPGPGVRSLSFAGGDSPAGCAACWTPCCESRDLGLGSSKRSQRTCIFVQNKLFSRRKIAKREKIATCFFFRAKLLVFSSTSFVKCICSRSVILFLVSA